MWINYIIKSTSYLLGLIPLILIFSIKAYDKILNARGFIQNIILVLFIVYVARILLWLHLWKKRRYWSKIPVKITEIKNNNHEQILYLVTYLIPLVSVDYDLQTMLQVLVILLMNGVLYCKTTLYYANPFLSLIWWNLYKASIENSQINMDVILLTKNKIIIWNTYDWLYIIDKEVILII
jgi:hypothetical protein